MKVSDLMIGQQSALRALEAALRNGRVAHFYVFAGPEGTGKRTTAVAFAKVLLCAGNQPDQGSAAADLEFCGACAACRQIEGGYYPDVLVWADRPRPTWWTSSRANRLYSGPLVMEEARRIREEMSLAPALGSRRIFIVDRADQMDVEPANCLLKTLEEPPGQRTLILLAENTARLLPTVLSRAEVIHFGLAEEEAISLWLAGILPGIQPPLVGRAVAFCGGRPGWAHLFSLNAEVLEAVENAVDALLKIASGDPYAVFWASGALLAAAKEWQRHVGEGIPTAGQGGEGEEGAGEETSSEQQIVRECLPLVLNAVLSFLRRRAMLGAAQSDLAAESAAADHLNPDFYGGLVPIITRFLSRLAANVNISLLLQLFCLEVAAIGERHPVAAKG